MRVALSWVSPPKRAPLYQTSGQCSKISVYTKSADSLSPDREWEAGSCLIFVPLENLAGATGLETSASCVTGRRSNQLNYAPAKLTILTSLLSVSFCDFYPL